MTQPHRPIALITGASSGIGRAIARRLAVEGYDLAICARRQARLLEIRDQLIAQGAAVLTHPVDLRQESQILDCFEAIQNRWGRLDVLINNAGLGHQENLTTGTTAAWRETLEVNVLALSICTREAIKLMRANGDRGHVVHISSMSGHRVPGSGMYSASKFAVRALTEGLRQELRAVSSGIRVSSISPGFVETEFAEKYHQSVEKAAAVYSQFPVLQPEDIANAIAYVLSQPDYVQVHDILLRPTQQAS
ncbi:MAG: SDR family NAD(P)-dependent oxidoreductase [Cyanobacteria bacterium P01_G01_bin.38]